MKQIKVKRRECPACGSKLIESPMGLVCREGVVRTCREQRILSPFKFIELPEMTYSRQHHAWLGEGQPEKWRRERRCLRDLTQGRLECSLVERDEVTIVGRCPDGLVYLFSEIEEGI